MTARRLTIDRSQNAVARAAERISQSRRKIQRARELVATTRGRLLVLDMGVSRPNATVSMVSSAGGLPTDDRLPRSP